MPDPEDNNQQNQQQQQGTDDNQTKQQNQTKTFTQEEVKSMMKKEKESGRNALLKELGIEDVDNYKTAMEEFKKNQEAQKTEAQKATERAAAEAKRAQEEASKASSLEIQLTILKANAKSDSLDDVTTLVRAKVNDSTTLEEAIKAVKEKFPSLFNDAEDTSNKGTGSKPNPNNKSNSQAAGLGKRLAEQGKPAEAKKSAFFSGK